MASLKLTPAPPGVLAKLAKLVVLPLTSSVVVVMFMLCAFVVLWNTMVKNKLRQTAVCLRQATSFSQGLILIFIFSFLVLLKKPDYFLSG